MLEAAIGGALIGAAAVALYATLGRIAGISGIAFGAVGGQEGSWRWPFLIGLMASGWIAAALGKPLAAAPQIEGGAGLAVLLAGAVLVGVGTRLGNGCTSGHGVCGLARLSARSLVSVLVFMALGIVSATFIRGALL
ncbi:MAG TPA: YeeE/YedE family protein [Fontimonas sp.]